MTLKLFHAIMSIEDVLKVRLSLAEMHFTYAKHDMLINNLKQYLVFLAYLFFR